MYVAWTLIYVGVAFVVNTTWPLVLLPAVLLLTHRTVLREEGDQERRFGAEYRDYKDRVRRYL
jgi:protein-S-isoprenylcysteine O-methyltransferase Ste14